jgi:hypothetical protein
MENPSPSESPSFSDRPKPRTESRLPRRCDFTPLLWSRPERLSCTHTGCPRLRGACTPALRTGFEPVSDELSVRLLYPLSYLVATCRIRTCVFDFQGRCSTSELTRLVGVTPCVSRHTPRQSQSAPDRRSVRASRYRSETSFINPKLAPVSKRQFCSADVPPIHCRAVKPCAPLA